MADNTEEKKVTTPAESKKTVAAPAAKAVQATPRSGGGNNRGGGRNNSSNDGGDRGNRKRGGRRRRTDKPQEEFESKIVDLARVTRVMAGGKRMSFRACVIIGDKKGRVAMGVKKGADVQLAVQKATDYAKKHLIHVPIVAGTIPHTIESKFKGAKVLIKPAKAGTGIIAGGPMRVALEMAGVHNAVAKMKGSNNKINNLTAVLNALDELRTAEEISKLTKN
ncbi:MAG: 30S ribosomal protein S5 [Candidatus Kerfeldbacteria bacterium CG15_BIG_FIL_POST_REV_8_21_14_020_45_12]|uniref:Small ribosomal subunit protein uS5 n=1 Tax=Candidatus Kerfeldbacteria bacterium CG15_BIG_FIL_POST_REV_8_21_14_020_45_12 TaxID=2014247 RepID=A0A2M7H3S4_9BACT|nr:MAG: 30S ribosomal protein S5 [Candidatus Kerfeldbacteria bacterium CG15_BIG_FIL_POST_REV_8_21_14_020_45_12]PJA94001.1 MAG: 30S ribosomal protein S5 [Candidatus Kerfeldbacteria bacterium CG_4_9_14_3_um_filter_45_8]